MAYLKRVTSRQKCITEISPLNRYKFKILQNFKQNISAAGTIGFMHYAVRTSQSVDNWDWTEIADFRHSCFVTGHDFQSISDQNSGWCKITSH